MTSFASDMQKEKLAAIGLVVIIVVALSAFLIVEYKDEIIDSLTKKKTSSSENIIEYGDCVDINYIGRYEDGSIWGYSYDDLTTKTGGTPLNIFISLNSSETPPEDYSLYSNLIDNQYYLEDFINNLTGLREGDIKKIGPIYQNESFGVRPIVGDVINLTKYVGQTNIFSIYKIQEKVDMPSEYAMTFKNITTTLYTIKDQSHNVGEIIEIYSFWINSSKITKINETRLWIYTTPTTEIGENFTYSEDIIDNDNNLQLKYLYPLNSSYISNIDSDNITITHNPAKNTSIEVYAYSTMYMEYIPYTTYTVENLTDDKINVSYINPTTEILTYKSINRTSIIKVNQSQTIIQPVPAEFLEMVVFSYLRNLDSNFHFGCSPFTETVYLDVEIVKVYKTSQES